MGPVVIRSAQLDDLGDLTEVFRSASLSNEGDRENLLAHPEFLELSDRAIVEGRLRLAEVDGVTVGFASGLRAGSRGRARRPVRRPRLDAQGSRDAARDRPDRAFPRQERRISSSRQIPRHGFYLGVGFRGTDEVGTDFGPGTRMYLTL